MSEDRIGEDWKNGKTALQILFIVLSITGGTILFEWERYVQIGIGSTVLLCIPYYGRWRTEDSTRRVIMLSVVWPATFMISWYIVMNEERWRKERIIHEVMET